MTARVPAGFARANGRIEVERVDVATKIAGRIAEIRVREGDDVTKGMHGGPAGFDRAARPACRREGGGAARRAGDHQGAEADVASQRGQPRIWPSSRSSRGTELGTALGGPRCRTSNERTRPARRRQGGGRWRQGGGRRRQGRSARWRRPGRPDRGDAARTDLSTPVAGRVEYKLTQPGEVLAAGGRVVTLLDLTDVYMTVFLPTAQVGRVALGSEARIVLDAAPKYVIPATVSFVAAEAQFTPKAVETATEREKLMYRVKVSIDPKLLDHLSRLRQGGPDRQRLSSGSIRPPPGRRPSAEAAGCPSEQPIVRVDGVEPPLSAARRPSTTPRLTLRPGIDHRGRRAGWRRQVDAALPDRRRPAHPDRHDQRARRRHARRAATATPSRRASPTCRRGSARTSIRRCRWSRTSISSAACSARAPRERAAPHRAPAGGHRPCSVSGSAGGQALRRHEAEAVAVLRAGPRSRTC